MDILGLEDPDHLDLLLSSSRSVRSMESELEKICSWLLPSPWGLSLPLAQDAATWLVVHGDVDVERAASSKGAKRMLEPEFSEVRGSSGCGCASL